MQLETTNNTNGHESAGMAARPELRPERTPSDGVFIPCQQVATTPVFICVNSCPFVVKRNGSG